MLVSGATSAGTAGATCSLLPVITGDPAETIQKVAASANCGKIISIYEYNFPHNLADLQKPIAFGLIP